MPTVFQFKSNQMKKWDLFCFVFYFFLQTLMTRMQKHQGMPQGGT